MLTLNASKILQKDIILTFSDINEKDRMFSYILLGFAIDSDSLYFLREALLKSNENNLGFQYVLFFDENGQINNFTTPENQELSFEVEIKNEMAAHLRKISKIVLTQFQTVRT
jgi:hypothetical protein